jgi:hypothetical protein
MATAVHRHRRGTGTCKVAGTTGQATPRSALSAGITAKEPHAPSPPPRLKVRSALDLPGSYRHHQGDKENKITATCRQQATSQGGLPTNFLRYCEPRHAGEAKTPTGMASKEAGTLATAHRRQAASPTHHHQGTRARAQAGQGRRRPQATRRRRTPAHTATCRPEHAQTDRLEDRTTQRPTKTLRS